MGKRSLWALIGVIGWAGVLFALQLPRLKQQLAKNEPINPQRIQAVEVLQRDRLNFRRIMPAFGYDNLVSSWTFLGFLHYFGNSPVRQVAGYSVVPEFFEVIVHRDPYFRLPYQFLSSSVTLFAGQPAETVRLLDKGLSQMNPQLPPDSFWLWRYKAVDELLFLGDNASAIQSLEQAAAWASRSPAPDAERSVQAALRIADFLRQDPDSREVRANSWRLIWYNALTEEVRQHAEAQIEALGYRTTRDDDTLNILSE